MGCNPNKSFPTSFPLDLEPFLASLPSAQLSRFSTQHFSPIPSFLSRVAYKFRTSASPLVAHCILLEVCRDKIAVSISQ